MTTNAFKIVGTFLDGQSALKLAAWADALLTHRPARLVSVALANKMARVAWALLLRGEACRRPAVATA